MDLSPGQSVIQLPTIHTSKLLAKHNSVTDALAEEHRQQRCSLIHLHGVWDGLTHAAARYARANSIPYLSSPRGMLEPWCLNQKKWKKQLGWWMYQKNDLQRAAALHATAELEAANLRKLGLTPPTFVIPNGIPRPPQVGLSRRRRSPRIALFLSRIHPKKGIELLIEAWKRVAPADWECRIVGPGERPYIDSLNSAIAAAGLSKVMTIGPPVADDEKWQAYEQASLFVLPTHSENFGIVIVEALAMRLPVITTTGTPWSNLPSVGCGWYVDPVVESLQSALGSAVSKTPAELQVMGDAGHDFAMANYMWDGIAQQFIQRYRDIGVRLGLSTSDHS